MNLELFHGLMDATGPFASVTVDETRRDPATSDHIEARWREISHRLTQAGAPAEVVEHLHDDAVAPTRHGGERGRLLVADSDGVLLSLDLPRRVSQDAVWGPIPSLVPAVRALSASVPHLVVRLDRAGADIVVATQVDADADTTSVAGEHDVLHRVSTGGTTERRFQARVEDSWERNATAVADVLDRLLRQYRPAMVLVMGDEHATSYLEEHASAALRQLLVRIHTGGRAEGTSDDAEKAAIESALAAQRAAVEGELVAQFAEQTGRAEAATEGLEPVIDVLQRAQVDELLLVDGRLRERTLWAGTGRLQLGTSREAAAMTGAEDPVEVPAEAALVWAALSSRAGVTLLDPGQASPADGLGAVLRWVDESTPRARVPSMPGHGGE